jgi:Ca2+-binding RTX toxin-like protein
MARLVNANGSTRGSTLVLNSVTAADQEDVRVVGLDGGGFVAAVGKHDRARRQRQLDAPAAVPGLRRQRRRRGAEQVVEGNDPSLQLGDLVALDGGGYAVGWHGRSWIDASARAYGADLQPLGDALVLHGSGGFQSQVDLTALADGRFAATWAAGSDGYTGGDGNGAGIETRVFATRGVDSVGSANADTLRGTPLDDRIDGGAGNDVLVSAGGNDTVIGGAGTDTLWLATPAADVLAHLADVQWVPGALSRVGSAGHGHAGRCGAPAAGRRPVCLRHPGASRRQHGR